MNNKTEFAEVRCYGPKERRAFNNFLAMHVDTTSHAKDDWQGDLSPFKLGPCITPDGQTALLMENVWQFSKVYKQHISTDGFPSHAWYEWRQKGFKDWFAHRYPMGKGARPEYSWWGGQKLGYIEARKAIYVPQYAGLVVKTKGYEILKGLLGKRSLALFDFDAYDYVGLGISFEQALNDPTRILGHGMVLCALLRGELEEPVA